MVGIKENYIARIERERHTHRRRWAISILSAILGVALIGVGNAHINKSNVERGAQEKGTERN